MIDFESGWPPPIHITCLFTPIGVSAKGTLGLQSDHSPSRFTLLLYSLLRDPVSQNVIGECSSYQSCSSGVPELLPSCILTI